jgi:phospholipid N-methyltransferase
MNNIIAGKMVFQRIRSSYDEININNEEQNNYIDDLKKEIGQDNKKKIFRLKNEIIKQNTNNTQKQNSDPVKKEKQVTINNKISKREMFFTDLRVLLNRKKFASLRENKKNSNKLENSKKIKLERNIEKKYSFRVLDLIDYYDINYKILQINSTERITQDKFYNDIRYLNVLEFFPNNGLLTCLLNNKLENSDKHFVVENNSPYFKILEDNKNSHNGFFNIINLNPEDINISEYSINCIIFNNICAENYEKILNIINRNLDNLKNNIFDIYFEKLDNLDMFSLYKILESISFIKKISEENREHWINSN